MKDKFLKILNNSAYPLEKYGAKFIPDYQFERVAGELEDALRKKECTTSVTIAMFERMHKELNLTLEDIANIHTEWEQGYFDKARGLNTNWAGLDPVKWAGVIPCFYRRYNWTPESIPNYNCDCDWCQEHKPKTYTIFGDTEDTNITP